MRPCRPFVAPELTTLQRELAETRQALVYQRQRTAEAERQVVALQEAQRRTWRLSLDRWDRERGREA